MVERNTSVVTGLVREIRYWVQGKEPAVEGQTLLFLIQEKRSKMYARGNTQFGAPGFCFTP